MRGYGQFCPVAKATEVIGERWTNLVVRELAAGSDSFNDLRKGLPLMSPSLLSARLKTLEGAGVVERETLDKGATRYQLTEAGKELASIIWQLGTWGHRWVRSELSEDDLDPGMLMWDIHRTMNAEYFDPAERVVVLVEFTNYTSRQRFWWLVIKDGEVDVCLKDPGYEVTFRMVTDLRTLTGMWMGYEKLSTILREGNMELIGPSRMKKDIGKWLGTNFYADVKPVK